MEDSRLGNTYEDEATGFKGVCVGVWLSSGQTQFALAYLSDGYPKSVWLDAQRLKLIEKKTTGFLGGN